MPKLNSDLVRHALSVAREHGFAEVELGIGEDRFVARLDAVAKKASRDKSDAESAEPASQAIPATLVGYYREAPIPLRAGAKIQAGDVVAVISALGIANDVESKVTGEVVEVLVQPGQAVEFGQPLARVQV